MNRNKQIRIFILWAMFLVPLLVIDPAKASIYVLIVPFCILFMAVSSTMSYVLESGITNKRRVRHIAFSVGSLVVGSLALASLGQLAFRDFIVLGIIILLGYFYVERTVSGK